MRRWPASGQVLFFLALTFSITFAIHWRIVFHGGLEQNEFLILPLMWTPGTVGLLCSRIFGQSLRDIGFGKPRIKHLALSYLLPAISALAVLVLLLALRIDTFQLNPESIEKHGGVTKLLLTALALAPTVGVLIGAVSALGEEIGWRGFLHHRLKAMNIRHPFLWTGVLWALWHLPLILFADYATSDLPYVSALLFAIAVGSLSVFLGWQREVSGTLWPAVLTHSAHNVWIQGIYPLFLKKGPLDPYFGGESGLLLALIYLSAGVMIYRKRLDARGWVDSRVPPVPNQNQRSDE